jgi:hypothetical protein
MLEVVPKPPRSGPSRGKIILIWSIGCILVLFAAVSIALLILARRAEPEARKWVINAIKERYQCGVEMGAFHASLYPLPKASVEDIVLTFHDRTDIPPLAKIRKMSIEASFAGLRAKPLRISKLTLEGLEVAIPPKTLRSSKTNAAPASASEPNRRATFLLEKVVADGMVLHLIPGDPTKDWRDFDFTNLKLSSVGLDQPMKYDAALGNWRPPGKIETSGQFGPWDPSDPGGTPLDGKYTFREANLGVFKGIAGTLSSDGEYHGRLNRIECSGTTDTPNFSVSVGKPVDLKTEFHAIVDGTNGDTMLEPVTAHFLKTTVVARGAVIGHRGGGGHLISLTVNADRAHVEDILHLTVNSTQPLLTGPMAFHASFELPPGPHEVIDRLNLKGHFQISSGHFTNLHVQDLLGNLSRRAEGQPKADIDDQVASDFAGDFNLGNAAVSFSRLVFGVPGAEIRLSGTYGIHGGQIDFTGQARTDAKLSQMTTGVKSVMLKFVDPFFKKDGAGAVLPIRITGTKDHPSFGLNFHKAKN